MEQTLEQLRNEMADSVCHMDLKSEGPFQIVRSTKPYPANWKPKKSRCPHSPELLREMYVDKEMTQNMMAVELKTTPRVIKNWLNTFDIKLPDEQLFKRAKNNSKQSITSRFENNLHRVFQNSHKNQHYNAQGYTKIYNPSHPRGGVYGYVFEHTYVIESTIKRFVKDNEAVHHINKKTADNRIENLALMTNSQHNILHKRCEDWGFYFLGMTTNEPAKILKFDTPVFWAGSWVNELDLTSLPNFKKDIQLN